MQFAKLAAGEQLGLRSDHRKLQHFKTFKRFSPKSQILSCDTVAANEQYNKKMRKKDGKTKWKIESKQIKT
jgi:hypothetical protein